MGLVLLASGVTAAVLFVGIGTTTADPVPAPHAPGGHAPVSASSAATPSPRPVSAADPTALPAGTGRGRRIVFSEAGQRVWLVDGHDHALSTYLVSGSVLPNLRPGTYHVYSRSRWAVGVDDAGAMQYFVRFTHGPEGAAIGFHTIPVLHGHRVQTEAQLGTPRSHGCIRQATADAIRLWEFAPVGTTVVVV